MRPVWTAVCDCHTRAEPCRESVADYVRRCVTLNAFDPYLLEDDFREGNYGFFSP